MSASEDYIKQVENCRLVLPKIFDDLDNYQSHFDDKILFVAKGPSLNHINKFIDFGKIATVNESCNKISKGIEYAFFFDCDALENSKPSWNKIKNFVTPPYLFSKGVDEQPVSIKDIKDFPIQRLLSVNLNQDDFEENIIYNKVRNNVLVTVDTSIMGLHFLVLSGYKNILLLGHDGGIGYADGVPCLSPKRNMQEFRRRIEKFASILKEFFQVKITFYDELTHE
jgi:hypothetical protein